MSIKDKNVRQHQGPISHQTFGKTSKNKLYRMPNPLKWEVLKIHLTLLMPSLTKRPLIELLQYIDYVKEQDDAEIIVAGGNYDKSKGYFIEPTIVVTSNPTFRTMCEEIFGPVITIYVYEPKDWKATLKLVDNTSEYALTGAIFSTDRYAIEEASKALENAAGNFYINDKPTGAVVGQQPFGGARGSGTNDKAGSILNLLRWVSPRTIKETFVPAQDYRYPFLG